MRKLFAMIIAICLLSFVGGYVAVSYATRDDYFAYADLIHYPEIVVGSVQGQLLKRPI